MAQIDRARALSIATRHRIPLATDFHALSTDQKEGVIAAADEAKYRKPKNANGSRARYFHAYLVRALQRY